MHFCTQCSNKYYISIDPDNPNVLVYYCKNCGDENRSLGVIDGGVSVLKTFVKQPEQSFSTFINKYTKLDPSLPRTTAVLCPNPECNASARSVSSSGVSSSGVSSSGVSSSGVSSSGVSSSGVSSSGVSSSGVSSSGVSSSGVSSSGVSSSGVSSSGVSSSGVSSSGVSSSQSGGAITATEAESDHAREIIYIRYDDKNMRYIYLCPNCDYAWKGGGNF